MDFLTKLVGYLRADGCTLTECAARTICKAISMRKGEKINGYVIR